jgi:4-hydroxythreonine-4-phosphate dehydrogenase
LTARKLPLALTLGEPAGIGPDITLQAWAARHHHNLPPFYLIGNSAFIEARARQLGVDVPIAAVQPDQAVAAFERNLPVVESGVAATAQPGIPDAASAPASLASIDRAVADVVGGRAGAVVTNPIAKSVLYQNGFVDPGHTEYLAKLAHDAFGGAPQPVMMLWSPMLTVVPVTVHLPLRDVVSRLTTELVISAARIVYHDLRQRFGIARPRLVCAGLNPHAGEQGTLGHEEETILGPALEALRKEGIPIRGPLSADTMFHAAARSSYDAALCMYHDQALIPIKTLAFDEAVNVTLGLPFVRTSPDHGTAFDIAGTGRADASSLIAALKLADRLVNTRSPAA